MRRVSRSLFAAAIAVGFAAAPASARVGVTSVADGEPLGQPPTEAERVLRVGIDIQASERVTTKANDRAHVVFLDGTALTIGPNSVLVIDKYVYDPNRKAGEMALSTTRGVLRFVGGSISKNSEVTVTTPSATIGIRGGIATVAVAENGATTAHFYYGDSLRVTSQGSTQTATRSGSQITAAGGERPSPPVILPPGRMPSTEPFERAASAGPASPSATRPVVQSAVNQGVIQAGILQQQQTSQAGQVTQPSGTDLPSPAATGESATTPQLSRLGQGGPIVTPSAAAIGDALDRSNLSRKNSAVTPRDMKIAAHFNPQGRVSRDYDGDGAAPPRRQPNRAGPPPVPQGFRPPPIIAKPQQTNTVKNAVSNQAIQVNNQRIAPQVPIRVNPKK